MDIEVGSEGISPEDKIYVGLTLNSDMFRSPNYSRLEIHEYLSPYPDDVKNSPDITDQIFAAEMTEKDAGILMWEEGHYLPSGIVIVTYDQAGEMTGYLPIDLNLNLEKNMLRLQLLDGEGDQRVPVTLRHGCYPYGSDTVEIELQVEDGYALDREYYLVGRYFVHDRVENSSFVTAAYVGEYSSIAEAVNAGAVNIKDKLFDQSTSGGCKADYSQGVYLTVFAGEDGAENQEIFRLLIKAEKERIYETPDAWVSFNGLLDAQGNLVECYIPDEENDSYGDGKYQLILVGEDTDLTKLSPIFTVTKGVRLRLPGSQIDEVSGDSEGWNAEMCHDFSNGPLHYTAITDRDTKNYWLHVMKSSGEEGKLYINSLDDEQANTREEAGVTYSTREVMLNSLTGYHHDILLSNIGKGDIPDLKAEIVSNTVKLDDYWTLKGGYVLKGLGSVHKGSPYGELQNLAKLRIIPKEGAAYGSEISGTLTIKSGEKTLMVLSLTGVLGDPSIVTKQEEIPDAVQYVPYGIVIRNNNKYDWNKVSYWLEDGKLPAGMEIRQDSGELYGVPTETGTFEFTVRMESSYYQFNPSEKTFTITVIENTDANVDGATDQGYELTQRVQDITVDSVVDQLMVSEGIYDEFVDIFLDGEKLQSGVDYTSESGSTRITLKGETLGRVGIGTHTLGIEFRTGADKILRRAAQNYRITRRGGSGSSEGSGGGGGSGSGSSGRSKSNTAAEQVITQDPKKGQVHILNGIITGNGAGYSHWQQDEKGWKLIYADGTTAMGHMTEQEDKTAVEQILWEKINGAWYAFGADGYLKSGWVYDYQLNSWYSVSVDTGMREGWYTDAQDMQTYYLEPQAGKLAANWKMIDSAWYYFNAVVSTPAWEFDKESGNWYYNTKSKSKPFGALYRNEKTPDGYFVNDTGVWDEKEK